MGSRRMRRQPSSTTTYRLSKGVRGAAELANVASYHTLSPEVGGIAAEAAVSALMPTHRVPPAGGRDALPAEVAGDFAAPVIVGEDPMSYHIGGRVLVHRGARLAFPRRRLGVWSRHGPVVQLVRTRRS